MNDLNQLLRDAADSDSSPRLNPLDLLSSGRRRVRNRRIAVAGGAVAAVVGAAVLITWLPSVDSRPDVVDEPRQHSSTYEEVRVPVEEVERRCSVVLNAVNHTEGLRYVAGRADDRTAISAAEGDRLVETREGWTVDLLPVGEKWPADEPRSVSDSAPMPAGHGPGAGSALVGATACVIPQADQVDAIPAALDTPVPNAANAGAVVDLCAAQTGYDLRGWEPLAVGSFDLDTAAILLSDNGYVGICTLYDDGWSADLEIEAEPYLDSEGNPIPAGPGELTLDTGFGSGTYSVARVLPGLPDNYAVSFSAEGKVIAETTTHQGAYLIGFDAPERARVTGRLTDPDGKVVWEGDIN